MSLAKLSLIAALLLRPQFIVTCLEISDDSESGDFETVTGNSTNVGKECIEIKRFHTDFMISLRIFNRTSTYYYHYCAGTLISEIWILTGAHCFHIKKKLYAAQANKIFETEYDGPIFKIIERVVHQDYEISDKMNDIGLGRVDSPTWSMRHVRLPSENMVLLDVPCDTGMFIGLGWVQVEFEDSEHLMCVVSHLKSSEWCARAWNETAKNAKKLICTYDSALGSFHDDSGGPLLCGGVQVGIALPGESTALEREFNFSTYTRVDRYLDFIGDVIKTPLSQGSRIFTKNSLGALVLSYVCRIIFLNIATI